MKPWDSPSPRELDQCHFQLLLWLHQPRRRGGVDVSGSPSPPPWWCVGVWLYQPAAVTCLGDNMVYDMHNLAMFEDENDSFCVTNTCAMYSAVQLALLNVTCFVQGGVLNE